MNTTPANILIALRAHLDSGNFINTVKIAGDPAHALDLLAAGRPGASLAVIYYDGDDPAPDVFDIPGACLVRARIRVIVLRHPGLAADASGRELTALDLAESVRVKMLAADLPFDPPAYGGMEPLVSGDNSLLHGYRLQFFVTYPFGGSPHGLN